jgi:DNA polymerase (family X)
MLPKEAARVLNAIADLLELRGDDRFKSQAYRTAARTLLGVGARDVGAAVAGGQLGNVRGIGPSTLAVIEELASTGGSALHEQLSEDTPEGLVEMLRVPGLGTAKIRAIHDGLGIDTLQDLEAAARDGRLAELPHFGAKTAEKVARGIAYLRETSEFMLYPHARAEAERLLDAVRALAGVREAAIAGSIRRHCPVVRDIDIVASCDVAPFEVAAAMGRGAGVRDAIGIGGDTVAIRYDDGTRLDLYCVPPETFPVVLWRATGNAAHLAAMAERGAGVLTASASTAPPPAAAPDAAVYASVGLPFIEPELREGLGEVDAALRGALPRLVALADIRGALHCHSNYSDGANTIAEMAAAALEHGWGYLGISDHSQSAAYAGGLTRDAVRRQHDEIESLRPRFPGLRLLKGIEADILLDGSVDYDAALLDQFDYVIASIHSRFGLEEEAMTDRVLRALDDPHVTILGHPTGRLLLTREPYAVDMPAVMARAAERGVAVELNADPHRLDLDWTLCRRARDLGCTIEIGPDAHSTAGLDNVAIGVGIARKGWLGAADVLNARPADEVLGHPAARSHTS